MHRPLLLQEGFLLPDLFRDGFVSVPGKITGAARTAENTAPFPTGAVPVRTRHPAVERELVHFFPERLFQIGVQRIIRLSKPVCHGFFPFYSMSFPIFLKFSRIFCS